MTSARGRRRLALIALLLISALALGIMSTQATGSNSGTVPGTPRQADDGTPAVVLIGDEPVSAAQLKATIGGVRANLDYMQKQIDAGSQDRAYLKAYIDLINAHGIENVALASEIESEAVYDLAVKRGFTPSDDAVKQQVTRGFAAANRSLDPATADYIASVGQERFWTEIYPETVRRQLATQALWQDTTAGKAAGAESTAAWIRVQQEALDAIHVTVFDANAIAPATTEDAIKYLHDYWQFTEK